MTDLIATLEGMTWPSREVDARIHYALFPNTEVLLDPGDMCTKRPARRGPLSEMPIDGWADYDAICHHIGADRYTASLDAITALVERVLPGEGEFYAIFQDALDKWFLRSGKAETLAIFVCTAALRRFRALEARDARD